MKGARFFRRGDGAAWRKGKPGIDRLITAPRLFLGSFLALVALGAAGLRLLPGICVGEPIGWLDALFTSTSAVCVTGLTVRNTATDFTIAGQVLILVLIQLGGLGIVTFSTAIIMALGRRLSFAHEELARGAASPLPAVDYRQLVPNVLRFTLLFETAGALALFLLWFGRLGWPDAAWHALFQSISAFCNAGFSTFPRSLTAFREDPATLFVIMVLIVCGGIGFLTIHDLRRHRKEGADGRRRRLTLNTRLVLVMTAILLIGGWGLFAFFEWNLAFREMSPWAKPVNALFMSVTARTAGFNTVDYAKDADSTILVTMILMFIGGSPGSTAGGIKTTTAALIGLLAWSRLRGRRLTALFGRSVREETTQRAVGLFVVATLLLFLSVFALTAGEIGRISHLSSTGRFAAYLFEATSAFNTVGLSMGVTPGLSPAGKIVVILLMYLGRVGPLTFTAAIALRDPREKDRFRFAYENIMVG